MDSKSTNDATLVLSYLTLRRAIGILGLVFPFVLLVGALLIFQTGIQGSMSAYYHTGMRDVFVGILCVIGVFLFSYKGYERRDDIAGDLGCVFAIGVALFPTTPDDPAASGSPVIGYIHLAFAGLFFGTLIYFSLVLFRETNPDKPPSRRKLQRNKIYTACGYAMAACIALIAVYQLLPDKAASFFRPYNPVYWLEAIAVVAFGISWFTKGEAILKDDARAKDE